MFVAFRNYNENPELVKTDLTIFHAPSHLNVNLNVHGHVHGAENILQIRV